MFPFISLLLLLKPHVSSCTVFQMDPLATYGNQLDKAPRVLQQLTIILIASDTSSTSESVQQMGNVKLQTGTPLAYSTLTCDINWSCAHTYIYICTYHIYRYLYIIYVHQIPVPKLPNRRKSPTRWMGFTGIHRGQALTVVGARVHGPQKPLRSVWQAPKPWAPLKATISWWHHSCHSRSWSRSRSLWSLFISKIFKVWKADGCWQSDSMLTVIMRFCKDWFLRFRWTQTAAASLLVLVIESHSLVFRRPGNPKTSSENGRPPCPKALTRLVFAGERWSHLWLPSSRDWTWGLCNASSSANLWICLVLLHKYVMATRDLSNFTASVRLQEGIGCWIKLSKFQ